jgi:hypothetical protein
MIPLELLRAYTGATEDVTTDLVLTDLERQAVAYVQRRTGRYFGPLETVTETIPGYRCWGYHPRRCRAGDRLYLTDLPALVAADYGEFETPVTVDVVRGARADDLTPLPDVALRQQGLEAWLVRTDGGTWDIHSEYHVTYVRGYAEGEEPDDIRRFVVAWVSRQWSMRGKDGIASETIGGYSYTLAKDQGESLSEMDAIIASWIRPVIA